MVTKQTIAICTNMMGGVVTVMNTCANELLIPTHALHAACEEPHSSSHRRYNVIQFEVLMFS